MTKELGIASAARAAAVVFGVYLFYLGSLSS